MYTDSIINADIIQAYLETSYCVQSDPAFALHVSSQSAELLVAQATRLTDCSAFITACNPFSEPLSDDDNAARQSSLCHELTLRGLSFLPGTGKHPSNGWPREPSFLVFALDLEAARTLAMRMKQNALIWSGADAIPKLILLR